MSYTNNIYTYIISPLETLIIGEFPSISILEEHSGNQSFVISPTGDALVSLRGNGQIRDYTVQIVYSYLKGGKYSTAEQLKHVTEIGERFKRLIWNNTDGSNWFDGKVNTIDYERDEENRELFKATIECEFSREEVI